MNASSLDFPSPPATPEGDVGEEGGFAKAPFSLGDIGCDFALGEPSPPPAPPPDFSDFHDSLPINCFHMATEFGSTNTTSNSPESNKRCGNPSSRETTVEIRACRSSQKICGKNAPCNSNRRLQWQGDFDSNSKGKQDTKGTDRFLALGQLHGPNATDQEPMKAPAKKRERTGGLNKRGHM